MRLRAHLSPLTALAACALLASPARAQDVPQPTEQKTFGFKLDALSRQEWTQDFFLAEPDQERWRFQVRPRLEIGTKWLLLGVGGDFNHSEDENDVAPIGAPPLVLIRDNYRARDIRLDLAFASLRPASWLRVEGGRFPMPLALTEMIWDRDLRPQGAALHLGGGGSTFGVSALGARGSHVYDDDNTEMLIVSAALTPSAEATTRFELLGSYIVFQDEVLLEPVIRRQNTRLVAGGPVRPEFKVVDAVLRLRHEGPVPWQMVADFCRNTAVDTDRNGLWLALVVGSVRSSRSRLEYTYAKVDKDATLAAYAGDDFFWGTGWEGHRGDIGFRVSENSAMHGVAQIQRFKDSPRVLERDHWIRRYRVELRFTY